MFFRGRSRKCLVEKKKVEREKKKAKVSISSTRWPIARSKGGAKLDLGENWAEESTLYEKIMSVFR